ncbi:uncharacterized protein C3orf62 homolog [Microcaecilia unicolor]|uniref:Uncharacterized protein C3orf62 homolog n=1 Tax=Microcaecilia unicolor TaxID=1415580 RepID=A0A6P7YI99_9AMPH|nr:uncharacterized protein C3orf62 homolog [Microcaecilia unicolor]
MSEKLRRCRRELTAAIDRAFEDIVASSFFNSQHGHINKHPVGWPVCSTISSPKANQLVYRRNATMVTSCLNPPFPTCYSLENVKPALQVSHIPMNANQILECPKRRPLTSKENFFIYNSSCVPDRQPMKTPGISDSWRKENVRTDDRCSKAAETNVAFSDCQEITEDLLDITEDTNIWTIEKLTEKLEFEHGMDGVCSCPEASPFKEEMLSLFLDVSTINTTDAESKQEGLKATDEDKIIETVLDMEEDYNLLTAV